MSLDEKIKEIYDLLKSKRVVVAFSGGVDSSVITSLASDVCEKVVAVTANSQTLPPGELDEAKKISKELGVLHKVVYVDELCNPEFVRNDSERCYYCKKELIFSLKKVAENEGCNLIIDGTNFSDLEGHRPGAKALREEEILSPFVEARVTKEEIREIARSRGLSVAEKNAMACLASRIPFGYEITKEKLERVGLAEKIIKQIINPKMLRVRDFEDLVKIEVGKDERKKFFDEQVMNKIVEELKKLGYRHITLDLEGYRPITPKEWEKKNSKS